MAKDLDDKLTPDRGRRAFPRRLTLLAGLSAVALLAAAPISVDVNSLSLAAKSALAHSGGDDGGNSGPGGGDDG